jgi:predicted dehydrogenase
MRIAAAGAGAALLPSERVLGANDRIRVGVIGVGGRGRLLIDQLPEGAEVVALADCWLNRATDFAAQKNAKWDTYQDYRKILDRKDIDGVIIATTDHGRVRPCIHACQAGKDVYAEKPLTLYVAEGRYLVKAARKYKRVFQVGSQQRTMETNRLAGDFIRKGGLGKMTMVHAVNYWTSKWFDGIAQDPVPEGLNWDMWLSQTPHKPYNKDLHLKWMSWREFSGGDVTNWGAHGFDQIQNALGMDGTGPVELYPLEDVKNGVGWTYANGVKVRMDSEDGNLAGGGRFEGTNGAVNLMRNKFTTEPRWLIKDLPKKEDIDKWRDEIALWQAKYHLANWLDCMKSRAVPNADVEIGHRSVSLCHLVNITRWLGRRLEWDPQAEKFKNDKEADQLLVRERRKGYEIPKV